MGRGHPFAYPTPQVAPLQLNPDYATEVRVTLCISSNHQLLLNLYITLNNN